MKTLNELIAESKGICWHEVGMYSNPTIHNNKIRCQKCNELVPIISACNFNPKNPDWENNIADAWELFEELPLRKKRVILRRFAEALEDYDITLKIKKIKTYPEPDIKIIIGETYLAWKGE